MTTRRTIKQQIKAPVLTGAGGAEMSTVYQASVTPLYAGFGEYEVHCEGPQIVEESVTSIADYLALAADADVALEEAPELDGRTRNQNGGKPYKFVEGDYTAYYMLWEVQS
jgi:hypothetical protein